MLHLALFGPTEIWIIGGIVVVLFGAKKLPELARSMGSSVTQFKKGLKEEPPKLAEPDDGGQTDRGQADRGQADGDSKD